MHRFPRYDCAIEVHPYFNASCFVWLDEWIKVATDSGQWVILVLRSKYGAGNDPLAPGESVFHNQTLEAQLLTVWRLLGARYRSFDGIAGYEVLAEPREKNLPAAQVTEFYEKACAAAQSADPRTPCVVGTAPYYKLWTVSEAMLLMQNQNVIYTFDYFVPEKYRTSSTVPARAFSPRSTRLFSYHCGRFVKGRSSMPDYDLPYTCDALYAPGPINGSWASEVCPALWDINSPFTEEAVLNYEFHRRNLQHYLAPLFAQHVPIFINQWMVVQGRTKAEGRYNYIEDLMKVASDHNVGHIWWNLASSGFTKGSSGIIAHKADGENVIDEPLVEALEPWLDGTLGGNGV